MVYYFARAELIHTYYLLPTTYYPHPLSSQGRFDRLQHLLHYIVRADPIQNSLDSIQRAAPLHTPLILRRSDDDAVGVDLPRCQSNQRRRYVVNVVERSKHAAMSACRRRRGQCINSLCQDAEVPCSQRRDATCDGTMQPHEDDDVVQVCTHFGADLDLAHASR